MTKKTQRTQFRFRPILWVNYIFIVLLLLTNLSPVVAPDLFWPISILGLSFPLLVIINFLFFIFWLLLWKRYLFYSALVIILSYSLIFDHFQINTDKVASSLESSTFTVFTYNAQNLSNNNMSIGDKLIRSNIVDFAAVQNADILCFQEFQTYPTKGVNSVKDYQQKLKLPHVFITPYLLQNNHEFVDLLVLYSSYPIENSKKFYMDGKAYGFYVDLIIESHMIRLFNLHLESNHFNKTDYDIFSNKEVNLNQKKRNQVLLLMQKLKKYSVKRSYQARTIRKEIEESPYPVIIIGDFNDTPASYTYQHIRQDLQDAFKIKGKGYSNTYNGKLPPMRIDYMLFDSEFEILKYQVLNPNLSDHFPIITKLSIP